MDNIPQDYFKQQRQNKRDSDANIQKGIVKIVKKQTSSYHTSYYQEELKIFENQFESLLHQKIKQRINDANHRIFRDIQNRRYPRKQQTISFKKFRLIMDYDFSIQ
ncbi:unnamed protein product [Paramecium octaurelia]|uniref:Uncharacterized protein n=1 Tax=Paramecium octaurelia TaxID=43137 RepID=A0A8S1XCS5_PAROT|nr:unnamed protein product [Paramecium octaurelia]CAD8199068.1 unnamed protein product [Paramecium octaurelia]